MIQNVKEKNLKRISRMFETQLQTSLDSMITIPQLVSYFWKTVSELPRKKNHFFFLCREFVIIVANTMSIKIKT